MPEPIAGFHPDNLDLIRRHVIPRYRENLAAKAASTSWDANDEFDLVTGNITKPGQVIVSCSESFYVQFDTSTDNPTNLGTLLQAVVNHVLPCYGATKAHYQASTGTPNVTMTVEGD